MTAAGRSLMLGAAGLTALAAAALLALTAGGPPEGTAAGAAAGRAVDGAALAPRLVGGLAGLGTALRRGDRLDGGVARHRRPLGASPRCRCFGLLARAAPLVVLTGLPVLAAPEAVFPLAGRAAARDRRPPGSLPRSGLGGAAQCRLCAWCWPAPASSCRRIRKRRRPGRGAAVAMAYALATTFAAVDWQMSLEPAFASSAFGLRAIAEQMTAAFRAGRAPVGLARPADAGARHGRAAGRRGDGLGLCRVHGVPGDLVGQPDRTRSSTSCTAVRAGGRRRSGCWSWRSWVVPLVALLFTRVRASLGWLAAVAALVLAGRVVDRIWRIVPAFDGATLPPLIATQGSRRCWERWAPPASPSPSSGRRPGRLGDDGRPRPPRP